MLAANGVYRVGMGIGGTKVGYPVWRGAKTGCPRILHQAGHGIFRRGASYDLDGVKNISFHQFPDQRHRNIDPISAGQERFPKRMTQHGNTAVFLFHIQTVFRILFGITLAYFTARILRTVIDQNKLYVFNSYILI